MRKSAPVIGPQLTNWSMVDSNLARGKFQSQVKYPEKFPTHIFFILYKMQQSAVDFALKNLEFIPKPVYRSELNSKF